MEAVYMRESKRHAWKLQAIKLEGGMSLAIALESQARERGYSVEYCVAVGRAGYADWPQSFRGAPYLLKYTPR